MKYLIDEATVFAIGHEYNIIFNTEEKGLAWVEIGNEKYCDDDNGNIKSEECVHKIAVPMSVLDKEKGYTICFCRAYERLAYFPKSDEEIQKKTYKFYPVEKKESYKVYMISDTHCECENSVKSGKYWADNLDFLILNGDIGDACVDVDMILTLHRIASGVTKGEKPVVYVRGNHDTRGQLAVELSKYIPTQNNKTYYTFALGDIFGICLDCGEDKVDTHPEYGNMANFEPFRKKQIEFLDDVIDKAEFINYKHVIVISHVRVNEKGNEVFKDVYVQWLERLNEIAPDVMICGHEHKYYIIDKDDKIFDTEKTVNYPMIVGSQVRGNKRTSNADLPADYIGTALNIKDDEFEVLFTNSNNEVIEKHTINR